ncbi:divergent polysaccharide deacetylase family protein [Lichenicoccus sp.]|uniref:divergent polysaccharide deacetylase family protein n=1 Tax=Lichenicoccus sp. TaxID=2781899 RepID=UPI003D14EC66
MGWLPRSRAGRALLAFWAVLLIAALGVAGTLQWLGPPPPRAVPRPIGTKHSGAPVPGPPPHAEPAVPESALLEPAPLVKGGMIPRIAADGRQARTVYAAATPAVPAGFKRVAILLDGMGLSSAASLDAIDTLPAAVSLAVSPYAVAPAALLKAAREAGHEILLSLPMQPAGAPLDDEGGFALTEQVSDATNLTRLQWALSRFAGYAGVTNAFLGMAGTGFAESEQFDDVTRRLGRRGLFYLDATAGAKPPVGVAWVDADLRLDDPPDAATIDRGLAALERLARRKGSAIGVAGPIFPVTVTRLADWAHGLRARGLVLVPVSSLVHDPVTAQQGMVQHGPR